MTDRKAKATTTVTARAEVEWPVLCGRPATALLWGWRLAAVGLLFVGGWGEALDGGVEAVCALGLEHPAGVLGGKGADGVELLEFVGG